MVEQEEPTLEATMAHPLEGSHRVRMRSFGKLWVTFSFKATSMVPAVFVGIDEIGMPTVVMYEVIDF